MDEYFYVCLYGKLEGPPSIIYKDEEISDGNGYRFTLSDTLLLSDLIFSDGKIRGLNLVFQKSESYMVLSRDMNPSSYNEEIPNVSHDVLV